MSSPHNKPGSSKRQSAVEEYGSWLDEATSYCAKAKGALNEARNLKAEIKTTTFAMLDRLVGLVKNIEKIHKNTKGCSKQINVIEESKVIELFGSHLQGMKGMFETVAEATDKHEVSMRLFTEAVVKLTEEKIQISNEINEELQNRVTETMDHWTAMVLDQAAGVRESNAVVEKTVHEWRELGKEMGDTLLAVKSAAPSYAEATARPPPPVRAATRPPSSHHAPHYSIIVSSSDGMDTCDGVVEKVRGTLNARECGLQVERLRKVRDGKIVISCASKDELAKAEAHLKKNGALTVEEAKNKNPLVVLKNLLKYNSDDDIKTALARQNKHILGDLSADEAAVEVRYRRRARNSHECHAVLRVSPAMWQRLTSAGRVYVDLQRVRVEDQSPLVQCTRCLGFGHGRKQCPESVDLCNYCGGAHLKAACPRLAAGELPSCTNCAKAKLSNTAHTAYGADCPTRNKWDSLARASVAYC